MVPIQMLHCLCLLVIAQHKQLRQSDPGTAKQELKQRHKAKHIPAPAPLTCHKASSWTSLCTSSFAAQFPSPR